MLARGVAVAVERRFCFCPSLAGFPTHALLPALVQDTLPALAAKRGKTEKQTSGVLLREARVKRRRYVAEFRDLTALMWKTVNAASTRGLGFELFAADVSEGPKR